MRNELVWFAIEQEKILKENDWKSNWVNFPAKEMFESLLDEVEELENAINEKARGEIKKECLDVANYAMMIYDIINNGGEIE